MAQKDNNKNKERKERKERKENSTMFNEMYCKYNKSSETYTPKSMIENIETLLKYYKVSCKYNQLTKQVEINIDNNNYLYNTTENQYSICVQWVYNKCVHHNFIDMNINKLQQILLAVANKNFYNPVHDYLEQKYNMYKNDIKNNGYTEIKKLCNTIECKKTYSIRLKEILITKWLIGAVECAYTIDGAKLEGVLTLQGGQGLGKTTWLMNLSPNKQWCKDGLDIDPSNKDSISKAVKYWLVELGEIESTFKKDFSKLKAFITQNKDEYRPPYGIANIEYPRRSIFCGSVNEDTFLKDETGNRRWWVIPCEKIHYQQEINLNLLWAEITALHKSGYEWWLTKEEKELLETYNKNHQIKDSIDTLIEGIFDWEDDKRYWMKSSDVYIEIGKPHRSNGFKIGHKLSKLKIETKMLRGVKYYAMPKNKKSYECIYKIANTIEPHKDGNIEELEFLNNIN